MVHRMRLLLLVVPPRHSKPELCAAASGIVHSRCALNRFLPTSRPCSGPFEIVFYDTNAAVVVRVRSHSFDSVEEAVRLAAALPLLSPQSLHRQAPVHAVPTAAGVGLIEHAQLAFWHRATEPVAASWVYVYTEHTHAGSMCPPLGHHHRPVHPYLAEAAAPNSSQFAAFAPVTQAQVYDRVALICYKTGLISIELIDCSSIL